MSAEVFRSSLAAPGDRSIVAYDGMLWAEIMETAEEVGPYTGMGKTNSAHVRPGADYSVARLAEAGQFSMFDSKFHDIPPTVELSVREATLAGAALITVHASGGLDMLKAAVKGAAAGKKEINDPFKRAVLPKLGNILGITVLTSLEDECYSIFGIPKDDPEGITKKVIEFTWMAKDAGLCGVVCSVLEARALRNIKDFDDLLIVTPGITPEFAVKATGQKRSTNARQAMNDGVDMVVVGRAINKAADYGMTKAEAAIAVSEEIKHGLAA